MQTIALFNQKGGVGKTTGAVNIAAGLVRLGRRVLLVDLDPQANATASLGIDANGSEKTTFELLDGKITPTDAIQDRGGLAVIPSGLQLAAAELRFSGVPGRELLLRDALEPVVDFDFIFIDCPPSLGLLTLNGLAAATGVYIPIATEYLSLQGINQLLETVELVRRRINKGLAVRGVFGTFYDNRKLLNRDVMDRIRQRFGATAFNTAIRNNVSLAEAPGQGQHIFDYSPSSHGAADFADLCNEIINRETAGNE